MKALSRPGLLPEPLATRATGASLGWSACCIGAVATGTIALAVLLQGIVLFAKFGAAWLFSPDVLFLMVLCSALLAAITRRDGRVLRPVIRWAAGASVLASAMVASLLMLGPLPLLHWTILHAVPLSSILACSLPALVGVLLGLARRHVLAPRALLPLAGWVSTSLAPSAWISAWMLAALHAA